MQPFHECLVFNGTRLIIIIASRVTIKTLKNRNILSYIIIKHKVRKTDERIDKTNEETEAV